MSTVSVWRELCAAERERKKEIKKGRERKRERRERRKVFRTAAQ